MNIEFLKNKNSTFWTLQIFGWLLFWLFNLLITHYQHLLDGSPKVIILIFLIYFFGFPLSLLMRSIYHRLNFLSYSLFLISMIIISSSIFAAHLWFGYDKILDLLFKSESDVVYPWADHSYLSLTFNWFVVLVTWSSFYFFINYWFEWNLQKERLESAEQLAQSAQMKMLRYQLNPHFLFNSLNSLRALIDQDERTAKALLNELTEFLHYSLEIENYAYTPLKKEIDAVKHYLAIEKIRYEEKLDVKFDVDSRANEFLVISFLINPLVENALKYGMKTSPMPLKLKIVARVTNNSLKVEVVNSGSWVKPSETGEKHRIKIGSGLDNIRERLEIVFPDSHRFSIYRREDGVHVEIEIHNGSIPHKKNN